MMEYRAEVRTVSSDPGRSARMIPSSCPPMRSMAVRERVLRTSVCNPIRCTCHTSKACSIMRSLASVFTADRCAVPDNQVNPISTTSGIRWRWWDAPGGHCQKCISQYRVAPTTRTVGTPVHRDEGHMGP